MSAENSIESEIARIRDHLNELAIRQVEEIGRLRMSLADLERRSTGVAEPQVKTGEKPERLPELKRVPNPPPVPKPARPLAEEPVPAMKPAAEKVASVPKGSFELQFGRVWLVRLGVALLVTGLVLLGNYAYRNWIRELPAMVRLAFLFLSSLGLVGVGWRFTLKEGMKRFGEVLLAGGLAFFYWCVFAAHHVDRLRVVESPVVAGLMLLLAAGAIVGVSLKRNARYTAVLGLLLASYATVLQPLGWLSSVSNVILAIAGIGLMRRPGWGGPGIASMVGTYVSFLWWQVAGAAGGEVVRMGLFFLPATWLVFALPGIAGFAKGFSRSLSERGRAWFAAANNGAFFGLFSLLWLMLGYEDYWQVPAVFGAVVLCMGSLGRSREQSGSTHVGQGLAMLTLALVLKLEGYQLALGLALEGLMLAGAFLRFRRPLELVFSLFAQILAVLAVFDSIGEANGVFAPVAVLLVGAGLLVRLGHDRLEDSLDLKGPARIGSALGFVAATVVAVVWSMGLEGPWTLLSMELLALGLALLVLKVDRKVWLPELQGMGLVFGALSAWLVFRGWDAFQPWVWLTSMLVIGGMAILWEKAIHGEKVPKLLAVPQVWLFGVTAAWSLFAGFGALDLEIKVRLGWLAVLVPGLAVIAARVLNCPRLRTSISLLLWVILLLSLFVSRSSAPLHFLVPISALATLLGSRGGSVRDRAADSILMLGTRAVALIGWWLAWVAAAPDHWLEVLALSGAALMLWARRSEGRRIPEAWILLCGTGAGLMMFLADAQWGLLREAGVPMGWGVVAAYLVAALSQRKSSGTPLAVLLLWTAVFVSALWSTLFVVQSLGWTVVSIVWTLLGFGYVCSGLWLRLVAWRHAGFALLGLALIKLFAMDVWDFGAFSRVAAFIALGVALVVLGFFYNRFAEILKRLFEGEGG
ncbi:DUF2339 domain-containing protein [Haloferula sp.]|uniref:DUF2339 domain-containing protein n=1 Tax=Haloferula sp. TaxID=2497595 RepID=UPI003C772DFE